MVSNQIFENTERPKQSAEQFPSIELAYPLAVNSYEVMQKRLDSINERIQTLIAFAATVTLAMMVVANSKNLSFNSASFIVAMIFCITAIAIGTYARLKGHLKVLDPKTLFDSYLDLPEWQFKKDTIYWAGENFRANLALINHKGRLASYSATLFLVEAVLLAAWALKVSP